VDVYGNTVCIKRTDDVVVAVDIQDCVDTAAIAGRRADRRNAPAPGRSATIGA
jgi:hypothetical protein